MEVVAFGELYETQSRNGLSIPSRHRIGPIPMVGMKEIFAKDRIGTIDGDSVEIRGEEWLLREGDLLFARQSLTYDGAGKCSLVVPSPQARTWESHLIRVRLDLARTSPGFYYYWFKSGQGRRAIEAHIQQVAAAGIRGSDLARVSVPLRPLREQRAIAEVLGALDDKIAANGLVSARAGELADRRFASAKQKAIRSGLTFDGVATVAGGGTPSTQVAEYWDGQIPWATPTDVTGLSAPYLERTARMLTEAGLAKCSSTLYPIDSILMTSRATIGAFALAKVPLAVNQGFIVAQARNPRAQLWLFHEMRSRVEDFLSHANGATFLELSKSKFKAIELDWPVNHRVFEAFGGEVQPLHDRAYSAMTESRHLAQLRDALLPHLMSGRITVRQAELLVDASG